MIPIFARSLQILLALVAVAGGSPVADQSNCPFGCLQVLDAERSRPVEEYAVSIVDESAPFPDFFTIPVGFPQPPRGSVVSTQIVRSPDGAHEFSAPVDPQLRITIFSEGRRISSVPAPRPGETTVVRLSRAFLLSGRVEDTAGRPVVGASVHLHRSEPVAEPRRPPMAMTDAQGSFQITPLYEKEVVLEVRHPSYQHFQDRVELRDPPEPQTFLLQALKDAGTRSSQPEPEIATTPPSREEAPTIVDVDSRAKVAPAAIFATTLPVAEPESTLSDLDRRVLREVLRDVRRRVHDVFDEMDDPKPWKLLVLARTEPFDWMEMREWAIGEHPFDAEPLLSDYDVERSGESVAIGHLIAHAGLEPVTLADLPLEEHGEGLPIAIEFVDHGRHHEEEPGRLPVLVSTTLPAMNDIRTKAIVFVRGGAFVFFQWIYHVEIQGGRPIITWVAEPVPSC